jgi:RNA polymerase subunit RPABC4/transcription elongation factor Spt4
MNEILKPILSNPTFILARQLCLLFLFVFWISLIFWTWRDAQRRGAMPWFWALVVMLFFPLFPLPGWLVYLVVRPPEFADDARERELEIRHKEVALQNSGGVCAACLKPVEKDFLICPYCMKKLKKPCVECGRALKMNWNVCPYCKTKQE